MVEAAYRVEVDEDDWLHTLADVARSELDDGFGTIAYTYVASRKIAVGSMAIVGGPPGFEAALRPTLERSESRYVKATWRSLPFALATEVKGTTSQPAWPQLAAMGVQEVVAVNGVQPNGVGVWLGALRKTSGGFDAAACARWARVGVHLGTALRLRRRLSQLNAFEDADAIIGKTGKIEDARGMAASKSERNALADAALALERARGAAGRSHPDDVLKEWRGLVRARWTLIEYFERDGKRFLLACKNAPSIPIAERLSLRERQVVGYVALGHSNKLIAYELGIASSTVGVLILRAARKLGATSRSELARLGAALLEGPTSEE